MEFTDQLILYLLGNVLFVRPAKKNDSFPFSHLKWLTCLNIIGYRFSYFSIIDNSFALLQFVAPRFP